VVSVHSGYSVWPAGALRCLVQINRITLLRDADEGKCQQSAYWHMEGGHV